MGYVTVIPWRVYLGESDNHQLLKKRGLFLGEVDDIVLVPCDFGVVQGPFQITFP